MYPNVRSPTGARHHPPPHPQCYSIFPRNWFISTGYLDPLEGKCLSIRPRPIVHSWDTTLLLNQHKKSFLCLLQPNNYKFYSCFGEFLPAIHLIGVFHHRAQCLMAGVYDSQPCAVWQDGRVSHGPAVSAWSGQSVTAACLLAA